MTPDEFTCPPFSHVSDFPHMAIVVVWWEQGERTFMKAVHYEDLESLDPDNLFEQLKSFWP